MSVQAQTDFGFAEKIGVDEKRSTKLKTSL